MAYVSNILGYKSGRKLRVYNSDRECIEIVVSAVNGEIYIPTAGVTTVLKA